MKTTTKWLVSATVIAMAAVLFYSCSKDNSANSGIPAGKSKMSIYLLDGPVPFTRVLVDIRQVAVKIDTAAKHDDDDDEHEWDDDYRGHGNGHSIIWDTLSIKPGVYDLLKLRNGTDTLLASGLIPNGKVLIVQVTLGDNNTIYTDSATHYPLNIIGSHPYFNINVRKENISSITNKDFKLWLDFDLARSIFFNNGSYWLKPWIKPFNDMAKPRVEGRVLPESAAGYLQLSNTADTLYAVPNDDGYFMMRGATAGAHSLYVKGLHGYRDTTVTNINVSATGITKIPNITLHK
jgi:hypothetical protein